MAKVGAMQPSLTKIDDKKTKSCVLKQQDLWHLIKNEAKTLSEREPMLASFFHATLIKHESLADSLSYILANKLATPSMPAMAVREIIEDVYKANACVVEFAACDIFATITRDPAVDFYSTPLLYLKGFHALQGYRVANWLWHQGRRELAIYFQNQISVATGVDVHPAASIGWGIMFDHATGIVVGETAVIENDVSILQDVTLGGTGKESGDRHPKIRSGVMIGAGAKVLGNIEIGEGAKIAACSVVLEAVPAHTTVAGVPAKIIGKPGSETPSFEMDQQLTEHNDLLAGGGI